MIIVHSPQTLYSWIHRGTEAILTAVAAYGITKIHGPYKIRRRGAQWKPVCSLQRPPCLCPGDVVEEQAASGESSMAM